ncbi:MAG: phosphatase PAP2 family protein [Caldilineaceae bacterium]
MTDQPSASDKEAKPPEQKTKDTAEEKATVKPVRQALRKALDEIDSQEKADEVIGKLTATTSGVTEKDIKNTEPSPATSKEAAQQVAQAAQSAPDGEKASSVLAKTARVITTAEGRQRKLVEEAAQEVLNPEQQGAATVSKEAEREYLRQAVLKRLKYLDALDANLFLKINHLPHTSWLNRIFSTITFIFTGGSAWFALMGMIFLRSRRLGGQILRVSALPLAIATFLVEFPIKFYFRRRRPFITIIQAIVIGKKPGTYSFPSGHSATAFAGAVLFSQHFPRQRGLFYTIAGLVAFSRIYLGDHYPGDVVSGSLLGTFFALLLKRLPWPWRTK